MSKVSYELSIVDRIALLGMLPQEADIRTMTVCKSISDKLEISQGEIDMVGLKAEGDSYTWDKSKEIPLNVEFTITEVSEISRVIDEYDQHKKIRPFMLSVINKIKGNNAV